MEDNITLIEAELSLHAIDRNIDILNELRLTPSEKRDVFNQLLFTNKRIVTLLNIINPLEA